MAIRKRGKGYQIYFYNPMVDGKRKMISKTIHGSLDEVRKQEKILKAEVVKRIELTDVDKGKMLLREFYMYWIKNYAKNRKSYNTIKLYDKIFFRINIALGHKKLNSIQPTHLLKFYKNLQECSRLDNREGGLSQSTIKKHYILLNLLFSCAVKWQILYNNPVKYAEIPIYHYKNNKKIMQPDELKRFLEVLEKEPLKHKLWVYLALGMGLRKGEIFGLKWLAIDFAQKIMSIDSQSIIVKGGVLTGQPLKTQGANRQLSIPMIILDLLEQYRQETLENRECLANKWEGQKSPEEDMIFTTILGKPAHPDSFATWLRRFVKKYNFTAISPHVFRHMSASYLINAGVDLTTVANRLGHQNSTTTQVVYAHLLRPAERKSAQIMDNILKSNR